MLDGKGDSIVTGQPLHHGSSTITATQECWDCCPSLSPDPTRPGLCPHQLGHVVDERVSLTVSVQISQLSAAVGSQVVDAEPSLPCTAGVEQGITGRVRGATYTLPHQDPQRHFLFAIL